MQRRNFLKVLGAVFAAPAVAAGVVLAAPVVKRKIFALSVTRPTPIELACAHTTWWEKQCIWQLEPAWKIVLQRELPPVIGKVQTEFGTHVMLHDYSLMSIDVPPLSFRIDRRGCRLAKRMSILDHLSYHV